jgi:hypothetical protein
MLPGPLAWRALHGRDEAGCGLCLLVPCRNGGSTPPVRETAQADVLAPNSVTIFTVYPALALGQERT